MVVRRRRTIISMRTERDFDALFGHKLDTRLAMAVVAMWKVVLSLFRTSKINAASIMELGTLQPSKD